MPSSLSAASSNLRLRHAIRQLRPNIREHRPPQDPTQMQCYVAAGIRMRNSQSCVAWERFAKNVAPRWQYVIRRIRTRRMCVRLETRTAIQAA